jgi:hypothetical protein
MYGVLGQHGLSSGSVISDGDDGYGSWCVVWGDVFNFFREVHI